MNSIRWSLEDQYAEGEELLKCVQPGILLHKSDISPVEVPHQVFFFWMHRIAGRLLERYMRFEGVREHECQWLGLAVSAIERAAEPPSSLEDPRRAEFLMISATLGPLTFISGCQFAPAIAAVGLIKDIFTWAIKRHTGNRKFTQTVAELAQKAVQVQGEMVAFGDGDVEDAMDEEQALQLQEFIQLATEPLH